LVIDSPRAKAYIGAVWTVFAVVNVWLMFVFAGSETIPYHLIWVSFVLLYGIAAWPRPATWTAFAGITAATAVPLIRDATSSLIGWEECSEIVLMAVIAGLLMWHVDRHLASRKQVADLLEAERQRAAKRELTTRFGSHELKTRLTIARGFVELVRDSAQDAEVEEAAEVAVCELQRATSLTENLMALVRFEDDLPLEKVDIDRLVRMLFRRWSAHLDRDWQLSVAGGTVAASPERVEAAIDSLIENAVKFTVDGDTVSVRVTRDGDDVVITVSDTGAGIPADELPRVTEVFRTGRSAGTRAGSGLGLAIVSSVVEARSGTLTIDSTVGQGTSVTMRLPRADRAIPMPRGAAGDGAAPAAKPAAPASTDRHLATSGR
jgi:signal transduction histidine kinase